MLLLQNGWSALHIACINGQTDLVEYLLTNGANLSATDKVNHITLFLIIVCLLFWIAKCDVMWISTICSYIIT